MALNSFRKVTLMFYPLFCGSFKIKKMIMGKIFIFITKQRAVRAADKTNGAMFSKGIQDTQKLQ